MCEHNKYVSGSICKLTSISSVQFVDMIADNPGLAVEEVTCASLILILQHEVEYKSYL